MSWTDERVDQLKTLWMDGQSASQIAKTLGGVTRNAVIGKVHRLGLSNRNIDPAKKVTASKSSGEKPSGLQTQSATETTAPHKSANTSSAVQSNPEKEPRPAAPTQSLSSMSNMDKIKKAAEEQTLSHLNKMMPTPALEDTPEEEADLSTIVNDDERANAERAVALAKVESRALKLSLVDLTERTCKWPMGDPATPDFHFCGLPCEAEKSYCTDHAKVAYQPVTSRRDRERNKKRLATTGGSLISRF